MILGVDVSHWDPVIDWKRAKLESGVEWMYSKASEGIRNKDFSLKTHIPAASAAGVLTGGYHFFHAAFAGGLQAEHFLDCMAGVKTDLPPVLDWEESSADGILRDEQLLRAKGWLNTVGGETGRVPIIYGGESFLTELSLFPEFAQYPLWIAHYGIARDRIKVPKPWKEWRMWQYTDAESVHGVRENHHVDASLFNGTLEELKCL